MAARGGGGGGTGAGHAGAHVARIVAAFPALDADVFVPYLSEMLAEHGGAPPPAALEEARIVVSGSLTPRATDALLAALIGPDDALAAPESAGEDAAADAAPAGSFWDKPEPAVGADSHADSSAQLAPAHPIAAPSTPPAPQRPSTPPPLPVAAPPMAPAAVIVPPAAAAAAAGPSTAVAAAAVPMCRYFLADGCYRSDCRFSHDTTRVPCRFFLAGGCTRGASCAFSHQRVGGTTSGAHAASGDGRSGDTVEAAAPPAVTTHTLAEFVRRAIAPSPVDAAAAAAAATDATAVGGTVASVVPDPELAWLTKQMAGVATGAARTLTAADFPALPSATTAAATAVSGKAGSASGGGGGPSAAPADPLTRLQLTFPSLPHAALAAALRESKRDVDAAVALLTLRHALTPKAFTPSPHGDAAVATHGGGGGSESAMELEGVDLSTARAIASSVEWVESGEAVSALYKRERTEAEALARARNIAVERATAAYVSGDSAGAAAHAKQGRELQRRMAAAHAAAAAAIFAARNGGAAVASGGGFPTVEVRISADRTVAAVVLDLHGLLPAEVLAVIEGVVDELRAAPAMSRCGWLALVTGTRHHSAKLGKGGGSIHAAVLDKLAALRLPAYDALAGGAKAHRGGAAGIVVARVR